MSIKLTKIQEAMINEFKKLANGEELIKEYLSNVVMPKIQGRMAVEGRIHTSVEGKLSIAICQGRRIAYMNADQLNFIINNKDNVLAMISAMNIQKASK